MGVIELVKDHDVSIGLDNLVLGRLVHRPWHTGQKTSRLRINLIGVRARVTGKNFVAFRRRPGLVGNLAVRRVDNPAFPLPAFVKGPTLYRALKDVLELEVLDAVGRSGLPSGVRGVV